MNKRKCTICDFEKGICSHHIIKRSDCGSDEEENMVDLCPNHHWIADFGDENERAEILRLIIKVTGKCGKEISGEEKEILDRKIRALEEECLCLIQQEKQKPFTDEEWENHKNTWNYSTRRKFLLGRGCSVMQSRMLHRRAEILLLIKLLKKELDNIGF